MNNGTFLITIQEFNYTAVFGISLAIALVSQLERTASSAVSFVKGWKS